jgi:hypothetical protein
VPALFTTSGWGDNTAMLIWEIWLIFTGTVNISHHRINACAESEMSSEY